MFLKKRNNFRKSYSQQGEDLVIDFIFNRYKHPCRYYLDIGANHPEKLSNSYYFSREGAMGVCVDPNRSFETQYKRKRPRDRFIVCGITGGESKELPYYIMDWHEFNTFDKVVALETERKYDGKNSIKSVINIPVININEFLNKNITFPVDFLNLDVEGFDEEIIQAWDFKKYKPKVICVESSGTIEQALSAQIGKILLNEGYSIHGFNHVNTIFTVFPE